MESAKITASQAAALAAFKKPDKPTNAKPVLNAGPLSHTTRNESHTSTSSLVHPHAASNTSLASISTSGSHQVKSRTKYPVSPAQQQVRNIYQSLLNTPKCSATDLTQKRTPSKMAASAGVFVTTRSNTRNGIDTHDSSPLSSSASSPSVLSAAAISAARSLQNHSQTSGENGSEQDKVSSPTNGRVVAKQSAVTASKRGSSTTTAKSAKTNTSGTTTTSDANQHGISASQSSIPSSSDLSSLSLTNPTPPVVGKLNLAKSQMKAKEDIQKLKSSIDAKLTTRDYELSRILGGYAPLEMIKNVREAIHSRMTSNALSMQPLEGNNDMIQSIRDSINLRRLSHISQSDSHLPYGLHERISPLCSPASPKLTELGDYFSIPRATTTVAPTFPNFDLSNEVLSSNEEPNKEPPLFDITMHMTPNDEQEYEKDYFGSDRSHSQSQSESGGLNSPISISDHRSESNESLAYNDKAREELISIPSSNLSRSEAELDSKTFGSNVIFQHPNGSRLVSSDLLQSPYLGKGLSAPSVGSSLSLSSSVKNMDLNEPAATSTLTTATNVKSPLSLTTFHDGSTDAKSKPRRKPPPSLLASGLSSPIISPKASNMSDTSLGNVTGSEDTAVFPRFPEIFKRGKQEQPTLLFGKKKNAKQKGVDYDVNLLDEYHEGSGSTAEFPTTPTGGLPTHAVRLKTTMRDSKKGRKDKHEFNENKPWKHHSDLNFLSESERKRYEGVWMSNKGLYINSVATKLVGVNYDGSEDNDDAKKSIEAATTNAPAQSLLAARISAKHKTADLKSNDSQFHNLDSVEPNQLIPGVVVKRIWKRSRLPDSTLATVWSLVDFRKDGTLNKPEFLVGMWLIDQCLYGRKLPKKVDDRVWESLGSIGVTLRKRKR